MPPKGSKKATRPSNNIVRINKNLYCHYFYQVRGAYTHLNQIREKDLDEAVAAATQFVYYDDPLHWSTRRSSDLVLPRAIILAIPREAEEIITPTFLHGV